MNSAAQVRQLPEMAMQLYRRAPASVMTLGSLALSYVLTIAWNDFRLFKALGPGGLGKPSFVTWLAHSLLFRPLAMPSRAALDPDCVPFDDEQWSERCDGACSLVNLPKRSGRRPFMYGIVPHRQMEDIALPKSEAQKAIIDHLHALAERFPDALTIAMSTYEASSSPCLFVHHDSGTSVTRPTKMARFYLSGTPSPVRRLSADEDESCDLPHDATKHELAHIHLSEGSLHVILSPQDARMVLLQGWGERHRLAGIAYRGNWWPPYWLPRWAFHLVPGGERQVRWGYQRSMLSADKKEKDVHARLLPPTYTSIYAPNTAEQVEWTKSIIDASVAWAMGYSF